MAGLPHLTCKRDHIKMRDYMDRWATPPKRVTSPIWGNPSPCKQALTEVFSPKTDDNELLIIITTVSLLSKLSVILLLPVFQNKYYCFH